MAASRDESREATAGYVGRFAPTPSGPLHIGSLFVAVASWLDARAHGGRWLLRIDDLDAPRVAPGAERAILAALRAHGLTWDSAVVRQSDHAERHRAALRRLEAHSFACGCTRRELRGSSGCPGGCRALRLPARGHAVRLCVAPADGCGAFQDRVQGRCGRRLAGDFVIWRRDDMAAYPLAVVVDDAIMGVTHVVRGADLLGDTPRQLLVGRRLGVKAPRYAHLPVVSEASGVKLSKHNAATAVDAAAAPHNIRLALALLGLHPPKGPAPAMLAWAASRWRAERAPAGTTLRGFAALA